MSTEHLDIMVLVPYLQFLPDQIPRQKFTLDLELYLQFPVLRNRSLHKLQKPRFFILCLVSLPRRSNRHTKMLVLVSSLFPEMHLQERSQHILRKDSQLSVFLGNLFTQMSDLFHLQMEVEQHLSMRHNRTLVKNYVQTLESLFTISGGTESISYATYVGIGNITIQEIESITELNKYQIPRTYVVII